jgi:integrase
MSHLPKGIQKRGNSLYAYLTHANGKIERRSLGNISPKLAEQQRQIWAREIAEGRYVKRVVRARVVLFSEIADAALESAKRYKRSWDTDESRIKRMKEWWGIRPADSITTTEIDKQFWDNISPRGAKWSETTSNEYRVLLSHIYKLASDRGEVTVNPAAKAHRYKLNNSRTRELSYKEEDRLRTAIRAAYPSKEAEFDLALHTGVRRSNLYGIRAKGRRYMAPLDWNDVDLDWKILRLPRAKGGDGYTVPLNTIALAALDTLRKRSDGTGPVIRKASGREIRSCRKWFENCLATAGISNFRWHDLRHVFGSRLRRNGVGLETIALLLDHGIPELRMTQRYAHASMERLHEAVATLVPTTTETSTETGTKTDTPAVIEIRRAEAV